MTNNLNLRHLLLGALISSTVIFTSCQKDNDISSETSKVNTFIHDVMTETYYWKDKMPDLNPQKQSDSKKYFNNLLYSTLDHWSFVTDNYSELDASLSGIEKSMGFSYMPYLQKEGSKNVVIYIEYVTPNSPADDAGLTRGMLIYKVNGTLLTTSNWYSLMTLDQCTFTFGNIDSTTGDITPMPPAISLTSAKLNINPILLSDIFDINSTKVGYLVYNSFIEDYEDELNAVFANFKANNVTELVIDLRYNGGGTVSTAQLLASMIGPSTIANQTMIRNRYNDILTDYFNQQIAQSGRDNYFEMKFTSSNNNLNLSRVFVLTSSATASASEMVIYSLKSYMNVIQIGQKTVGKYYGMFVFNNEELNWGVIPICFRSENATASIDYTTGLIPDYEIKYDDYSHELGDTNELFLNTALSIISGSTANISVLKSAHDAKALTPINDAKERINPLKTNQFKRIN